MDYSKLIETLNVYKEFKQNSMADNLTQAYLFVCEDRLTSNVLLSTIASLVVCEVGSSCGRCGHCIKVKAGTHPDVLVYPMGKNFIVEDAGDIYDKVQIKPMLSNKKVFIINDMDLSTEQAQNKMLKIIEEPPKNVIFLLSAKNENKILQTIHSRVQKKYIDKIDKNLLKDILKSDDYIQSIALTNGDGYLGKTLDIETNEEYLKIYENMKKLVLNLKNSGQIPIFSPFLSTNKLFFEKSLYILNDFFRDLLMLKLSKKELVKNINLTNEYSLILDEYSIGALVEILKRLNLSKEKLDSNVNLTMLADGILMEILEVKYLCK